MTRLARRLTAQLLAGVPAPDPRAVTERLLAIQAQDPRGARLAIRARARAVTAADIDRALTEHRSLVITWLNRGTLHLVRTEDYPLLQMLTAPPLMSASARRLAQEGVTPDAAARATSQIERWIAEEGPLTRLDLRERLRHAGVPVAGQALVQLLFRAAIEGRIVRGPMVGGEGRGAREHAYARVADWLPAAPAVARDRETALAELTRRYLAGHGPATDRDLARWAGLPLRDARAGLQATARLLISDADGLVDLAGRRDPAPLPPPRLLGAFEPVLMGWRSRADVLGAFEFRVVSGGVFRGFALVDGRAAAGWRIVGGARVRLEPWAPLAANVAAALDLDAAAVHRFLTL